MIKQLDKLKFMNQYQIRTDWSKQEITELFSERFIKLMQQAMNVHQHFFPENVIQISSLLSIKTGGCPEDCAYCAQSSRAKTDLKKQPLVDLETVSQAAQKAKQQGITRLCMGAAWRNPPENQFEQILAMVKEVKKWGLEACMTLGMLNDKQVKKLKEVGLDYYNHNLDTSPTYYKKIITTRSYDDRLATLEKLRQAGIKICCGGIIGMGENEEDRIDLLLQLANFPQHPQSVPINRFVAIEGTSLNDTNLDPFAFIKVIAVTRILMPKSTIRLTAGRETMSDELQALCFFAGANSIFVGEKLLTVKNSLLEKDLKLLQTLGLNIIPKNTPAVTTEDVN